MIVVAEVTWYAGISRWHFYTERISVIVHGFHGAQRTVQKHIYLAMVYTAALPCVRSHEKPPRA